MPVLLECAERGNGQGGKFRPRTSAKSLFGWRRGSGTIFFAGCNLNCCFCQNYDIALDRGWEVTDEVSRIMLGVRRWAATT